MIGASIYRRFLKFLGGSISSSHSRSLAKFHGKSVKLEKKKNELGSDFKEKIVYVLLIFLIFVGDFKL